MYSYQVTTAIYSTEWGHSTTYSCSNGQEKAD